MKDKLFKKIDGEGLAVFRIFYSIILFCEIVQLYTYREIIYGAGLGELNVSYLFLFWFVMVGLIFAGLFTRTATTINYFFSVIIFSSAQKFEYHVFYLYVGINFLLMFMPVSRMFSLDALLEKVKYSRPGYFHEPDRKVLAINYFMPVLLGLAFVYFDSILYKLTSPMWLKGLGMWLPASLPMATWTDTTWLMNQEWLVKFFGYLVIVFETLFIFLFWFRSWRAPLLFIGVFFHIGILIQYPIPWFALSAIAVYILMIPVSWWQVVSAKLKFRAPRYYFYYDSECPLCIKTVSIIQSMDGLSAVQCIAVQEGTWKETALQNKNENELFTIIHGVDKRGKIFTGYYAYAGLLRAMVFTWPLGFFMGLPGLSAVGKRVYEFIAGNRLTTRCTADVCPIPVIQPPVVETQDFLVRGVNRLNISRYTWITLIAVFAVLQFLVSFTSPLPQEFMKKFGLENSFISSFLQRGYHETKVVSRKYLGFTHHALFMDFHFKGYNNIIRVDFRSNDGSIMSLPLLTENGMPDDYLRGALWANYTFRVSSPHLSQPVLESGLLRYFNYFTKHSKKLKPGRFIIYVKEIEIPDDWRKDFLKSQIEVPWVEAGYYTGEGVDNVFFWNPRMKDILENEGLHRNL